MSAVVKGHNNLNAFTARERVVRTYGEERKQGAWHIIGTSVYGDNKRAMLRTAGQLNKIDRVVANRSAVRDQSAPQQETKHIVRAMRAGYAGWRTLYFADGTKSTVTVREANAHVKAGRWAIKPGLVVEEFARP